MTKTIEVNETLIGDIYINGEIIIADPCYDKWEVFTTSYELLHGFYNCYAVKLGKRVQSIFMLLKQYSNTDELEYGEEIGTCGVDSGQLGIFLKADYSEDVSEEVFSSTLDHEFPYEDWKNEYTSVANFYNACCNTTLSKDLCGVIDGRGFVSSSGYGDGMYRPYVIKNSDGVVVGVKIDFISVSEEEL